MDCLRVLELLAQYKPMLASRFGGADLALFGATLRGTAGAGFCAVPGYSHERIMWGRAASKRIVTLS